MIKNITIHFSHKSLKGTLFLPELKPKAWIIFSHGSGSSHLSPRNRQVAKDLSHKGFGALLFDLLTIEEEALLENRFNIEILAERLIFGTDWLIKSPYYSPNTPIGYFGASTGAAAALEAKALAPKNWPIYGIVSRGGRVDLAKIHYLREIHIPVLLIVGERDHEVIRLNMMAQNEIPNSDMIFINEAGHLFEEPGALESMTRETIKWFEKNLPLNFMEATL